MLYNDELAEKICDLISEGSGIRKICSLSGYPSKATLFRWLAEYPKFQQEYSIARQIQAESMLDEMLDIATNCPANATEIRRATLKINTLQWLAPKMLPKKYGANGTGLNVVEVATPNEFDFSKLSDAELDAWINLYTIMNPDSELRQRTPLSERRTGY